MKQPAAKASKGSLQKQECHILPANLRMEALEKAVRDKAGDGSPWLRANRQKQLCRFFDLIEGAYQKGKKRRGAWVNLRSTKIKREGFAGRSYYKEGLALLEAAGIIECNPHYSDGKKGGKAFTKSYRLGRNYRHAPLTQTATFDARKERKDKKDGTEGLNDVQLYIHNNIHSLTVDEEKLQRIINAAPTREKAIRIIQDATKVAAGIVNLKQGERQRRQYHSVSSSCRLARKAYVYEGQPLAEVDVKSCQPVLLASLCPPEEKASYLEMLKGDIYQLSTSEREKAKKEFGQFAFGSGKKRYPFGEGFKAHFPKFTQRIREFPGSLACYLQDLEAEICIYGVADILRQRGIFSVPIHDGFLVRPLDAETVRDVVKERFESHLGFPVEVKVKPAE